MQETITLVRQIEIEIPWTSNYRRRVRGIVGELVESSSLQDAVRIREDERTRTFRIEGTCDEGRIGLARQGDRIRQAMLDLGVRRDKIVFYEGATKSIHPEDSDRHSRDNTLETLQRKVRELTDELENRDNRIVQLETETSALETRLREETTMERRGDLHVKETIRLGRARELEELSRDYTAALYSSCLGLSGDVNQQIVEACSSAGVPFARTQFYKTREVEIAQATEAIRQAESGNPFVNVAAAREVLDTVKQAQTKYDASRASVQKLRDVMQGKSILYLVLTEDDETNHKINIVLPIRHKEDSKDFPELETDLIAHIHDQWSRLRTESTGSFSRQERSGLVEYTFKVPKGSLTPEKMKELEDRVTRYIFETQKRYSFGALGLRIDLEKVASTAGLTVPEEPAQIQAIAQPAQPRELVPEQTSPRRYNCIESSRAASLTQQLQESLSRQTAYAHIPLDRVTGRSQTDAYLLQLLVLDVLAQGGEVYGSDVHKAARTRLQEIDFSDRRNIGKITNALRGLEKAGIIEKVDFTSSRQTSYRIRGEYK